MRPYTRRVRLMGAALAVGALTALPAAAQQCPDGLAQLDQRIGALEAGASVPATPQEVTALRSMRMAADRLGQAGNAEACATVVRDALAMARSIEAPAVVGTSELRDMKIRGSQNEDVGSIDELVIDPNTGRVAYGVVELGGFLGIGERHFPVPWDMFERHPQGEGLVLRVPKDKLTGAPQFTRNNRPNMSDRQWAMAVHTYYGVQPYWVQDAAALAAPAQGAGGGGDTVARLNEQVQQLSQEVTRLNQELTQARSAQAEPPASAGQTGSTPGGEAGGGGAPRQ